MSPLRERIVPGARGARLHAWTAEPGGPARGDVLLVHGIGEHSGRYGRFVDALVARGWAVHGYDHRGHGRSSGQRGHVTRWGDYLEDLATVLEALAGDGPRYLLAHSMGGLVALDAVLAQPGGGRGVSGVIVSAPPLAPGGLAGPVRVALARVLTRVAPRLPLPMGVPADVLSHDPDVVRASENDPLCHNRVTPRWGAEILAAIDRVNAAAERFPLPLLLLQGDEDRVSRPEGTRRFFERVGHAHKTLRIYEGARHEPHNDVGAERVVEDVLAWLEARG